MVLCGAASAQSSHSKKVRRVTQPLLQADLDLSTGQYTIGSKINQKSSHFFNTSRSLSNVDFAGFVGIDSVQCEWFDTAEKGMGKTGGKSEIMTSFLFAYCSSARATQSGGVGGSATVSFVEGYMTPALGGARPTFASRTAVYNLSGLPANTAASSFFGGFNCFFIRIRTATPVSNPGMPPFDGGQSLADGVLGWSWDFRDLSLSVPLAHTFPFMACVTSCSGVGPDGQTISDGIDQFCGTFPNNPPFGLLTTFTFGTVTTYTSLNMEIREANAIPGATSIYNPAMRSATESTENPVILSSIGQSSLGDPWKLQLDCTAATIGGKPAIYIVEFLPGNVPVTSPSFAIGHLLISLAAPVTKVFIVPGASGSVGTFPPGGPGIPIPIDLQFLDVSYQIQGFCGDTPKGFLSNGLNQTMGSF